MRKATQAGTRSASARSKAKPITVDEYLVGMGEKQRAALEQLRRTIRKMVPKAQEGLSYGLAAFRLHGRPLVAFGASVNHCALDPMSAARVAAHKDSLRDCETSKGTIRFQPDNPLPVALVRKLMRSRFAESQASRVSSAGSTARRDA